EASVTDAALRAIGRVGSITYTCAPPGSGVRMAIERDEDGALDGDERDAATDPASRPFIDIPSPALPARPTPDAGLSDAGSPMDAGLRDDAASLDGGPHTPDPPSGCGCRAGGSPSAHALALAALVLTATARRRRRHSTRA
ncbi:MAG: hypothetical protein K1X94_34150, partial [Sandaracinaceae bacterium]|nr:hypothetical protein [Sandaracinaceae bacterium]